MASSHREILCPVARFCGSLSMMSARTHWKPGCARPVSITLPHPAAYSQALASLAKPVAPPVPPPGHRRATPPEFAAPIPPPLSASPLHSLRVQAPSPRVPEMHVQHFQTLAPQTILPDARNEWRLSLPLH